MTFSHSARGTPGTRLLSSSHIVRFDSVTSLMRPDKLILPY